MRNVNQVIEELDQVYSGLLDGTMKPEIAKELNNTVGKMLKATAVQLTYADLRKEKPNIPFLNTPESAAGKQ